MKNALRYFAAIILLTSTICSAQAQTNIPNVWNGPEMTFDSLNVHAKPASRDIAKGESWLIAPLLLDNGVPRTWSSNAVFTFNWQPTGSATNWYSSTNVVWPLYHSVVIGTTSPVVTAYVYNLTNVVLTAGTNGTVTTNITYSSNTNLITTYVSSYTTVSQVDTGRVGAVWVDGMDYGFANYNWYIGYQDQSSITYRVTGTLAIKNSPGYSGMVTNAQWSYPWATTNYVISIFNQMLWLSNSPYASGYFYLMAPN